MSSLPRLDPPQHPRKLGSFPDRERERGGRAVKRRKRRDRHDGFLSPNCAPPRRAKAVKEMVADALMPSVCVSPVSNCVRRALRPYRSTGKSTCVRRTQNPSNLRSDAAHDAPREQSKRRRSHAHPGNKSKVTTQLRTNSRKVSTQRPLAVAQGMTAGSQL